MNFNSDVAQSFLSDSTDIVSCLTESSRQLSDLTRYDLVRKSIESLTTKLNDLSINVNFFGSRVIGVASEDSDLDIFVCIDNKSYKLYENSQEQRERLDLLEKVLHETGEWRAKEETLKTVIPVVFAFYVPMQLKCDVMITNGLSTCKSRLIKHLFEIQPEAVPLFHFVRQWLKAQDFNLMGYTITLLVVFYLECKRLLPPVEVVQRGSPKEEIDGWQVQFNPDRSLAEYKIDKMISYKDHVKGFFKFYKDFDYTRVMSTYTGQALDAELYKSQFPNFLLRGILLACPLNHGKNCGNIDDDCRAKFVELMKASSDFLD